MRLLNKLELVVDRFKRQVMCSDELLVALLLDYIDKRGMAVDLESYLTGDVVETTPRT